MAHRNTDSTGFMPMISIDDISPACKRTLCRIRTLLAAMAVVMAITFCIPCFEAAAQTETEITSGAVIAFEPQESGENQDLTYQWNASDGSPLSSSERIFHWTAPDVQQIESVTIGLLVRCADGSCPDFKSKTITVKPKEQDKTTSSIELTKSASKASAVVGQSVTYQYVIKNTGKTTVQGLTLSDDKLGAITITQDSLLPGESTTGTADYTLSQKDLPGPLVNSARAIGTDDQGEQVETNASASVTLNPGESSIRIEKSCIYADPVRIGDSVTYVYNVTNTGGAPLKDVKVTDVVNWGPGCVPVYVSGDDGDDVLDAGESWRYECKYTVQDPESYKTLSIMSASNDSAALAEKIRRLMAIKARLQVKIDRIREKRDRFDLARAEKASGEISYDGKNFSGINYTNAVTEETLSQIIDGNDTLRQLDFTDPVTEGVLISKYNWLGNTTSEMYISRKTNESLEIEYDLPEKGYKTYTISDQVTGDTLIMVVNQDGNILSKEYRKIPGFRILEEKIWLKNVATVTANDPAGNKVTDDDSFQIQIKLPLPKLGISKKASTDPVKAGEDLTYTVSYQNNGEGEARGVKIKETYDSNITFISSDPVPDQGSDNLWTIGTLAKGASGEISIRVNVKPTVKNGAVLNNLVKITGDENQTSLASTNTTVEVLLPELIINKTASESAISPGGILTYRITYKNTGRGNATNVNITDILDKNVELVGSNPEATRSWVDTSGQIHLWWSSEVLSSETFEPGRSGSIEIAVRLSDRADLPKDIYNLYKISSDQADGSFYTLRTEVLRTLTVEKTADKTSSYPGQMVNYTVNISNPSDLDAEEVVAIDRLPSDMDYVGASPEPAQANETTLVWHLGKMPAGTTTTIKLSARIKERPEVLFDQSSSVTGTGYVYSRTEVSTGSKKDSLTNYVEVTAYYGKRLVRDSDTFTVTLLGTAGAEVKTTEHGSGYYEQEQMIRYNSTNKSVRLDKDIFANCSLTRFSLPGNRKIAFNSLWHDRTTAENFARNETVSESYLYSEVIDKEVSFLVDENQSVYRSDGELTGGMAAISFVKNAPNRKGAVFQAREDYHGDFRIQEAIDSYGSGVSYSKNGSGLGFVSSDKASGRFQRSSESGSGYYRSDEISSSGVVYKDSEMAYQPNIQKAASTEINYTSKWHEEMATGDEKEGSEISESISSADSIKKETIMEGSSMAMLGEFNGSAEIKAVQKNRTTGEEKARVEQFMMGSYKVDTSISIHKVPKYLRPHINVTVKALKQDENTVLFKINVTNDGNKTLGPVYITDTLPNGLKFVNSSTRPKVSGRNVTWTILSLGIGRKQTIDLRARIKETDARFVNQVKAVGYYEDEPAATAEAYCSFVLEWLPCCLIDVIPPSNESNLTYYRSSEDWAPAECMGLETNCTGGCEDNLTECISCNNSKIEVSESESLDPPYPLDEEKL
jgi:uncharacterized repeat protein (TIGR01451 family)